MTFTTEAYVELTRGDDGRSSAPEGSGYGIWFEVVSVEFQTCGASRVSLRMFTTYQISK